MLTLTDFLQKYTGKFVGTPLAGLHQCVALVEAYAFEVLGDRAVPAFPGNAINIFGERAPAINPAYHWVRNNPADVNQLPPIGAIMCFAPSIHTGVGALGHVDIVIDRTATFFDGFDQNWPVGAPAHAVRHSYVDLIGWGYPVSWDVKPAPVPVPTPVPVVPPPLPVPSPPRSVFWTFSSSSDLHPADGTMTFESAWQVAKQWQLDHPGETLKLITQP